jgi:glutathione S-transferase
VLLADSNTIMIYLVKRYAPTSTGCLTIPSRSPPYNAGSPSRSVKFATVRPWHAGPRSGTCRVTRSWLLEIAGRLLGFMEQHLSDRDWLAASHITLADLACYSYMAHAPEGGISLNPYPCVRRWLATVEARPWFKPMPASPPHPSIA